MNTKKWIALAIIIVMVAGLVIAGWQGLKQILFPEAEVELIWPSNMVTDDPDNFEEANFLFRNPGFTSIVRNEDNTFTVRMYESTFEMIQEHLLSIFKPFILSYVDKEGYEYYTSIDTDDKLSSVTVIVKKDDMPSEEKAVEDLRPLVIALVEYRSLTGQDNLTEISIKAENSEEILATCRYPDDFFIIVEDSGE